MYNMLIMLTFVLNPFGTPTQDKWMNPLFSGWLGMTKYTTFYRLFQEKDATVLKEITTECHWVGAKSLYRTMVVSERMSTVEAMKASAVESISSKKGPLKSLKKRKAEQQEQRNQKRRPQQKDKCIDMCSFLAMVSEQLQSLATFLLSRLVDFDVQKCPAHHEQLQRMFGFPTFG